MDRSVPEYSLLLDLLPRMLVADPAQRADVDSVINFLMPHGTLCAATDDARDA